MRLRLFLLVIFFASLSWGCGGKPTTPMADQAFHQLIEAWVDYQPQIIWDALPTSYQKEITEIVGLFAQKMDRAVWGKGVTVIEKSLQLTRDKKMMIIHYLREEWKLPQETEHMMVKYWDNVVDLLFDIVHSDLTNLDRLSHPDIRSLLAGPVSHLIEQSNRLTREIMGEEFDRSLDRYFGQLKQAEVSVVNATDSRAKIHVHLPELSNQREADFGEGDFDLDLMLVEGRWIPTDVAGWLLPRLTELRDHLKSLQTGEILGGREDRQASLFWLGLAELQLDRLLATKTEQEFRVALKEIPRFSFWNKIEEPLEDMIDPLLP